MNNSALIFQEFSRFNDDSVMIAFRGDLSEKLLDALLALAEEKLADLGCRTATRKKAFHILVECIQNIYKHSDATGQREMTKSSNGIIIMTATEHGVRIATGNSITRVEARFLKSRLETIVKLDSDNLRKHYKDQLVQGKFSDSGGAGLGFLDIARKSGQQVDYDFAPIDKNRLFFTFNVQVA
ncbi:MAG: SiaB family protein kinase [Flavobacteriales bacterium]